MALSGLATGIGSLPFKDPDPALDLIFSCCPQVPFWPQLPRHGVSESMVAQFSEKFPCLRLTLDGVVFDCIDQDRQLEKFYDRLISQDLESFALSRGYAPGLWRFYERLQTQDIRDVRAIKLHVTGPFTFAASINDGMGLPLLHDEVFMQAFVKGLIMKASWQIKLFRRFGKQLIIFIDEPYLSSFGSAFAPVTREDVLPVLAEFCTVLSAEDVHIGVHCCGNTDWSLFTETKGLDIINFDAFDFLDRIILYAQQLDGFLSRGGILCWGIVPTELQDERSGLTKERLREKIEGGIRQLAAKGINEKLIRERLLISPACGLGNRDIVTAQKVFKLLKELSDDLRA
jgi:methionine synthase II (cobalamin-independent)